VSTTPNWRIAGWTIVTLRAPDDEPFPLGLRGYYRHGLEQAELDTRGGAVAHFREWADREAATPAYAIAVAKWKQGNLFNRL
jgi:hypothetical protein